MDGMMDQFLRRLRYARRFTLYLFDQFSIDDCRDTAAALTYQTLFAVVPLLTVGYSIINSISAFDGIERNIEDFIFSNFVPESGPVIQQYLHDFSTQARNLTVIGILFLAVTAFLMLYTIERAFNEIWRIMDVRRGFQKVLLYWAVLSLGPLLVGFAFAVSTYLYSLPLIAGVVTDTGFFLKLVPGILTILAFTLIYGAVPNCFVPARHALAGGIATAIVFEVAKYLFGLIMSRGSWQVIYGTFAAVPLFLFWIYLSWNIILLGAEFVRALSVYEEDNMVTSEPHLFQILAILEEFHRAHREGKVLREKDLLHGKLRISQENWSEYRHYLLKLKLIQPVERGGYVLARDLRTINVWELDSQLPWPLPVEGVMLDTRWKKELSAMLSRISEHSRDGLKLDLISLYEAAREEREQNLDERAGA